MAQVKPLHICTRCGQHATKSTLETRFYMSHSEFHKHNGRVHLCKECCAEMALQGTEFKEDKLIELLRKIDKPYISLLVQSSIDEAMAFLLRDDEDNEKGLTRSAVIVNHGKDVVTRYFKNIAMPQYSGMVFFDGEDPSKLKSNIVEEVKAETVEEEGPEKEVAAYNKAWRGNYTQTDLEYLNNYLFQLKADFNIITDNHLDYAKKIAKASLAADRAFNELLEGGSEKKYKDLQEVFDKLSKSAQFAEAGRSKSMVSNGITDIVDSVEAKTWIYKQDKYEKDDIDLLLEQFSNINKSL